MSDSRFQEARAVVLGGAGFLGSHLSEQLLAEGAEVVCIDNFMTGSERNVSHLFGSRFTLVDYNITNFLHVPGDVDYVFNFASPASPVDFERYPIQILKVGALGTHHALGLALAKGATFVQASTSEVYGDPLVNPQPESYWGNVNPTGVRGVYDEGKRYGEALTMAYQRAHGLETRIVRIFNSILADESVLYDDGTSLRRETAREAANRFGGVDLVGVSVPSFGHNGSVEMRTATAFVAHPSTSPCYEVTVRYGRTIRVTGDHSVFVEGPDGGPVEKTVSDLTTEDRVAVSTRCDPIERDLHVFEIAEEWIHAGCDPWGIDIMSKELGDVVWRRRFEVFDYVASTMDLPKYSRPRAAVWARIRGMWERSTVPLALIRHLGLGIPGDARTRLHTAGFSKELPALIPVSNELLWLLGMIVAEGHIHRSDHDTFVTISCDDETLDRCEKIIERDLGLTCVRQAPAEDRTGGLYLHSKLFVWVLERLGFDAGPKRIPGWILGLPASRLGWLLEGYREGDGVHSGEKFETGIRHEFSTTSEQLKDDLIVAFARFGLVPSVGRYMTRFRKRTGERLYPFWRLTLPHVDPWSPLDWHRGVNQRLQARRFGDLVYAKVRSIEQVENTDLVYDFCVPGTENFWAGGGVMAHNTFGPRMRPDDGRAVPAFFSSAIRGEPLPVHGDGSQTRSLCYVDDLIEGILRLAVSDEREPVNIGNPHEISILELAETIQEVVGTSPGIDFQPRPIDDPNVRSPDITKARAVLGWEPQVDLRDGLQRTYEWLRERIEP